LEQSAPAACRPVGFHLEIADPANRRLHCLTLRAILHRNCDAKGCAMKTASLPALRVDPALRHAAEEVLQKGESLSSFVEQSVRAQIEQRKARDEFIARGLASRDGARLTGTYVASSEVVRGLLLRLGKAKAKAKKKAKKKAK